MLPLLTGCASAGDFKAAPVYHALGHEPGWLLSIGKTIDFAASPNMISIKTPTPLPMATQTGRRYAANRIVIDLTQIPCIDSKSGIAFTETVAVVADNQGFRGCGGKRARLLDQ